MKERVEDTSKLPAQGPGEGEDKFDEYRLALDRTDFQTIDRDKNNSLDLEELKSAGGSDDLTPEKRAAIAGLQQHLESTPKMVLKFGDQVIPTTPSIASWFDRGFVQSQVSEKDFDIMDKNHDGTLSRNELFNAWRSGELSPMTKHAANILKDHLDMAADDPLLGITNPTIKRWFLTPEQQEAKENAEVRAEELTRRIKETKSPAALHGYLMKHYRDLQDMWSQVKQLPGNPVENMEAMFNRELRDTGHEVKVHLPTEKNAPRLPWMRDVDAFMTVNPRPQDINTQMWGYGIIGLGLKAKGGRPVE